MFRVQVKAYGIALFHLHVWINTHQKLLFTHFDLGLVGLTDELQGLDLTVEQVLPHFIGLAADTNKFWANAQGNFGAHGQVTLLAMQLAQFAFHNGGVCTLLQHFGADLVGTTNKSATKR